MILSLVSVDRVRGTVPSLPPAPPAADAAQVDSAADGCPTMNLPSGKSNDEPDESRRTCRRRARSRRPAGRRAPPALAGGQNNGPEEVIFSPSQMSGLVFGNKAAEGGDARVG
ncbi:hypothetical protein GCM10010466_63030 [Planomonospora alba]|uniref:Uncharacterized protein n=1 Tax=Planomonospora alba TaxID=161354 RepID=A0ABP6P0G2_9ACTN